MSSTVTAVVQHRDWNKWYFCRSGPVTYTKVADKQVLLYCQHVSHSPPCNVGLHELQHVCSGFTDPDKGAIVDLPQTKQLKNLPNFRMDTVDTAYMNKNGMVRTESVIIVST